MARVLLINPPIREFARPNNAPLGLLYIASYLEQFGHEVEICDLNAARQITNDWNSYLSKFTGPYEFTGLSGLISTTKWQRKILDFLQSNRSKYGKLVLGGGVATFAPGFVRRNYPEIDFIVFDEGEESFGQIVQGIDPAGIDGIEYRKNKFAVLKPKSTLIENLDSLPFPDYSKVPVEIYLQNAIWGRSTGNSSGINYDMKRSLNMIMSRGCSFNCSFCAHAFKIPGIRYRQRSPENVLAEFDELVNRYNIDFVGFVDDNVCGDRDWLVEFCIKLIEKPYRVHWGCSARVDEVDEQLLELMRHADCEWIGYGIEHTDPGILRAMRKGNVKEYKEQAIEAIRLTKESGIWCNCTFIIGYPGETWETIRELAKFMQENDVLNNMFYATAYPSTHFYNEHKDRVMPITFPDEDSYIRAISDATELKVNFTDLTDEQLAYARSCAINGKWDCINTEGFNGFKNPDFTPLADPLLNVPLGMQTAEGLIKYARR